MTEIPSFVQQPSAREDDDFIVDAQSRLAKQLVRYSAPVSTETVRAFAWLKMALGAEADDIIDLAMEHKDRQAIGGRRHIVQALKSLAAREVTEAQIGIGTVLGKGK